MSTRSVVRRVPRPAPTMMKSPCVLQSVSLAAFAPRERWNTKESAWRWRSVLGLAAEGRKGGSVGPRVLSRATTTRSRRSARDSVSAGASAPRGRWISTECALTTQPVQVRLTFLLQCHFTLQTSCDKILQSLNGIKRPGNRIGMGYNMKHGL